MLRWSTPEQHEPFRSIPIGSYLLPLSYPCMYLLQTVSLCFEKVLAQIHLAFQS